MISRLRVLIMNTYCLSSRLQDSIWSLMFLGMPSIRLAFFGDCATPPVGRRTVLVVFRKNCFALCSEKQMLQMVSCSLLLRV